MKLSKRLHAVADMVTPGFALADIGTDHAYIPIYLAENKIIPHAIAMDVNRGPLARAKDHIREHALDDVIETRLSDGLAALRPGEAQSVVIAGMGGALTVRILREGERLLRYSQDCFCSGEDSPGAQNGAPRLAAAPELILQPQSEVPQVRAYLAQNGFHIVREDMVFEDGKYYPMMKAECSARAENTARLNGASEVSPCCAPADIPLALQLAFGPELLKMRHPVLHRYLQRERKTQERILEKLRQSTYPEQSTHESTHAESTVYAKNTVHAENAACLGGAMKRAAEVRDAIRLIDEALGYWEEIAG